MVSKVSNHQNYPIITGLNNSPNIEEVMQKVGTQNQPLQMKKKIEVFQIKLKGLLLTQTIQANQLKQN